MHLGRISIMCWLKQKVSSDASGRSYAGVGDFPAGKTMITAGEFSVDMLSQDIQVKEGEALRATFSMMVNQVPHEIQGKTLLCKVDNQALKAVMERREASHNFFLNQVGKRIFWLTEIGQFHLALQYVKSEDNDSDSLTRQSPGLESSLSKLFFKKIWDNFGPFKWDLMAFSANVNHNLQGKPSLFFSR